MIEQWHNSHWTATEHSLESQWTVTWRKIVSPFFSTLYKSYVYSADSLIDAHCIRDQLCRREVTLTQVFDNVSGFCFFLRRFFSSLSLLCSSSFLTFRSRARGRRQNNGILGTTLIFAFFLTISKWWTRQEENVMSIQVECVQLQEHVTSAWVRLYHKNSSRGGTTQNYTDRESERDSSASSVSAASSGWKSHFTGRGRKVGRRSSKKNLYSRGSWKIDPSTFLSGVNKCTALLSKNLIHMTIHHIELHCLKSECSNVNIIISC